MVDRLYQIGASPDHRLRSGRIGDVIWIVDASANLFDLDGAVDTERCRATGAPRCELSVLVTLAAGRRSTQLDGSS